MDDNQKNESLTHKVNKDFISKEEIQSKINEIQTRISTNGKYSQDEVRELIKFLDDLADFDLGRFLIYNKGAFSGYWTYYVIKGYNADLISNMTEKFIINNSPAILATRERFGIFQKLLSKSITENSVVCTIPSGVMGDIITLEIDEKIKDVKFVGIDLDSTVFDTARKLIQEYKKTHYSFSFFKEDAWNMRRHNQFNTITSNGLNIYEKDDEKVVMLYKNFFNALKPGGVFIGSSLSTFGEWDQDKIDQECFKTQRKIFGTILEATWQNYRTRETTELHLKSAGFNKVEFYWDSRKIFYSFKAEKCNGGIGDDRPYNASLKF